MNDDRLRGIAADAAAALVAAMGTDAWYGVRDRYALAFGAGPLMEDSRRALAEAAAVSHGEWERVRARQVVHWHWLLRDLVARDPDRLADVRALAGARTAPPRRGEPSGRSPWAPPRAGGDAGEAPAGAPAGGPPRRVQRVVPGPRALAARARRTAVTHPVVAGLLAAAVAVGGVVVAGVHREPGAAGSAPDLAWTVVRPATPVPAGGLTGLRHVACASATDCWAFGDNILPTQGAPASAVFAMHLSGGSWRLDTPPPFAGTQAAPAVACASATSCWAATSGPSGPFVHYDGHTWRFAPTALGPEVQINGITCAAVDDCWAVGTRGSARFLQGSTLVVHYDGTDWNVDPSPAVTDGPAELFAVSCALRIDCWAVGYDHRGTVALHYDGGGWSRDPSLETERAGGSDAGPFLDDVTCPAAGDCWFDVFVGDASGPHARTRHLSGDPPTSTPAPAPGRTAVVRCTDPLDCWSAGYDGSTVSFTPVLGRWRGGAWTRVPVPSWPAGRRGRFSDLACPTPSTCWAVGISGPGADGDGSPLIVAGTAR